MPNYYTYEELEFLREYKAKNPAKCLLYCQLILAGMRTWDKTIEVGRVVKAAKSIVEDLQRWN